MANLKPAAKAAAAKAAPIVASLRIEGRAVIITLPIEGPTPSASGKSMVLASTRGNLTTSTEWEGRAIVMGVNVYFK